MDTLRGALAGLAGGLAGGVVRTDLVARLVPSATSPPEGVDPGQPGPSDAEVARQLWEDLFGRELPEEREAQAARVAHYALAGGFGALYGALAARTGTVTTPRRAALGAASWVIGSELAPRLGLPEVPGTESADPHASELSAAVGDGVRVTARRPRGEASP